jgi:calcium binding protein
MARVKQEDVREHRIDMEVVVDAYDEQERAMGWYNYLEDKLDFPFQARCIAERRTSPMQREEVVKVTGMAPEEDCEHDMLVDVQWQGRSLAVPLSQLEGVDVDEATQEAIGDWHYWVARGYEF